MAGCGRCSDCLTLLALERLRDAGIPVGEDAGEEQKGGSDRERATRGGGKGKGNKKKTKNNWNRNRNSGFDSKSIDLSINQSTNPIQSNQPFIHSTIQWGQPKTTKLAGGEGGGSQVTSSQVVVLVVVAVVVVVHGVKGSGTTIGSVGRRSVVVLGSEGKNDNNNNMNMDMDMNMNMREAWWPRGQIE